MQNDIQLLFEDSVNPTIISPYTPFKLPFNLTRERATDIEYYEQFLSNACRQFRQMRVYKNYKAHLMEIGLNHSQLHGNLDSNMVDIEMHHNLLTIFDIAFIITEHTLNTVGYLTSFDLIYLLRLEHARYNRVQLVMLDITSHQLLHNTDDVFIHPLMCFGKWWEFLQVYNQGITPDLAKKITDKLDIAIKYGDSTDGELSKIRNQIKDWSGLNGCSERVPYSSSIF